jgi:hypothetical protein
MYELAMMFGALVPTLEGLLKGGGGGAIGAVGGGTAVGWGAMGLL